MEHALHRRLGRRAVLLFATLLAALAVSVGPAQAAPAAPAAAEATSSAIAAVPDEAPAFGLRAIQPDDAGGISTQGWTWIR